MKNVLLMGDSIRLGYDSRVRKLLGDDYNVYSPVENCRYTKYTLWGLFSWMQVWEHPEIDVVHWNNGIWDLHRCSYKRDVFVTLPEYLETNRRLAGELFHYCKKLIWATTIPGGRKLDDRIPVDYSMEGDRPNVFLADRTDIWNADVRLYNKECAEMLSGMGVAIDDLYAEMEGRTEELISDDGIHPNDAGYDVLAAKVAAEIRKAAEQI